MAGTVAQRDRKRFSRAFCNSITYGRGAFIFPTPDGMATGTALGLSRIHWSFLAQSTSPGNYFTVPQALAANCSPGDTFFWYAAGGNKLGGGIEAYGGQCLGGPFTVQSIQLPFAGFINVIVHEPVTGLLRLPSIVIEGAQVPWTPPQALLVKPRSPKRYSRAWTANVTGLLNAHGPTGTMQPRVTVPVPRRYPARAVTSWVTSSVKESFSITGLNFVQQRWIAGQPAGRWRSGPAQERWIAGEPVSRWRSSPPGARWITGEPRG